MIMLSFISMNIFAQYKQGSLSVGGMFDVDLGAQKDKAGNTTTDGPTTTSLTLIPSVEYFITDKFSVGLGVGYKMVRTKTVETNTTTIVTTGSPVINPFARMYFSMGDKVSLFGEGGVYIEPGSQKTKTTAGNITTTDKLKDTYLSVGVMPGISLSLSNRISIEATFGFIGYNYEKKDLTANSSRTNGDVVFDVWPASVGFGIRYFIK